VNTSALTLSLFELCVALCGAAVVGVGAPLYLRKVQLPRPPIGTFNGRDIAILFGFLCVLPAFYLLLPRWLLTTFLAVTFIAALSIGMQPLMPPAWTWLTIGVLVGADLWIGRTMLGTVAGWQLYWVENSLIVLLAAVSVANLYVQGGMRLRHIAWFALALACYDVTFTSVLPLTNELVEAFLGFPLDPSVGMRAGFDNASLGLGDLVVYALYTTCASKAYGRAGTRLALTLVIVCGAVAPALAPLAINYVDARMDVVVPAQAWFGPAAYLGYRWLRRRHGRERTMREFRAGTSSVLPASPH
jgi:hypothetical protein